MDFNIDMNLNIFIYNYIANQIIEAIEKGIFKPGERLSLQRKLSAGFNIFRGTI